MEPALRTLGYELERLVMNSPTEKPSMSEAGKRGDHVGDEEQTITAPTPPQGQTSSGPPSPEESAEQREAEREARMRDRAERREARR